MNTEEAQCPIETTLRMINGKWKLRIIKELLHSNIRFGQILKNIPGISPKVLSQQLKEMEEDGIIERIVISEMPPNVEYVLTDMGESLLNVFKEIKRWGMFNLLNYEKKSVKCLQCRQCQDTKYNC